MNLFVFGLGFSADGDDPVRARSTILDALGRQVAWTKDFNKLGSDPQKGLELMLTEQVPKLMLTALRDVDLGGAINAYLDSSLTASGDLIEKMTAAQVTALLGVMQGGKLDDIIKGMGDLGSAFADVNARIIELNSIYGLAPLFDALGLSIFKVGVDVVKALGGLDAAQNALATYYDRFYSDAEKLADLLPTLATQHAALVVDTAGFGNQAAAVAIAGADFVLVPSLSLGLLSASGGLRISYQPRLFQRVPLSAGFKPLLFQQFDGVRIVLHNQNVKGLGFHKSPRGSDREFVLLELSVESSTPYP